MAAELHAKAVIRCNLTSMPNARAASSFDATARRFFPSAPSSSTVRGSTITAASRPHNRRKSPSLVNENPNITGAGIRSPSAPPVSPLLSRNTMMTTAWNTNVTIARLWLRNLTPGNARTMPAIAPNAVAKSNASKNGASRRTTGRAAA